MERTVGWQFPPRFEGPKVWLPGRRNTSNGKVGQFAPLFHDLTKCVTLHISEKGPKICIQKEKYGL